jgi:FlaA1/EpsC-like NDP-sugar epimerase
MRFRNVNSDIIRDPEPRKTTVFVTADMLIITASMWGAFVIRFDGVVPSPFVEYLHIYILLSICTFIPLFRLFRMYTMSWHFVSIFDLYRLFSAVTFGSVILAALAHLGRDHPAFVVFPRSVLITNYVLCLIGIGGLRASKRAYLQVIRRTYPGNKRKVLVVGAGSAGEQIVRDMLRDPESQLYPVGFIDDARERRGFTIHGVKILGGREKIPGIVRSLGVEEVLIAIPSASSGEIRNIVEITRGAGITDIRVVPSLNKILSGQVKLGDIRKVQVEDILGREPVTIRMSEIEAFIRGKRVLITGAGGSIGSELARQVPRFLPKQMILLDIDETELFHIDNELRGHRNCDIASVVANIQDRLKIRQIFEEYRPDVVFHAAAYKHVPVVENHPDEAVKNNVFGTRVLAEVSRETEVRTFIFISTDKAVNPTSVMGATKRVAEMMVRTLSAKNGGTRFTAVRFGNVMESRGSVIPTFKEQISRGGPVTVTHPDMKRYFMTVSEAVLLVLQASAMGQGGEVFVLNMGEAVRIADLARELIRLSGFESDRDIPIVYTGVRPGEKLFEELLSAEEGTTATEHERIFRAKIANGLDDEDLFRMIADLERSGREGDIEEIIRLLMSLVPTYTPSTAPTQTVDRVESSVS